MRRTAFTASLTLSAVLLTGCTTSTPSASHPQATPASAAPSITPPANVAPTTGSESPVTDSTAPANVEAVDLGLSVPWANINVGATSPEEYGPYYGWGDTTGTLNSTNNNDYPSPNPPASIVGTEHDAAHVLWGGGWRMPTHEEQMELYHQADWKAGSQNGVPGWTVTGPNGNSIFLAAGGGKIGDQTSYDQVGADFWSGTLDAGDSSRANVMWFYNGNHTADDSLPRHYRFAIRAVIDRH